MFGSQSEYAKHAGLSKPRISNLKREGRIVFRDGKVDFAATDELLGRTLHGEQSRKGRRRQNAAPSAPTPAGQPDKPNPLLEIRLRREMAECAVAEAKARQISGELFTFHEFMRDWIPVLEQIRDRVLAIPDRIAPEHGRAAAAAVRKELTSALRSVVDALAQQPGSAGEIPPRAG